MKIDSPHLVAMLPITCSTLHVSPSSDWRLLGAEAGSAGENWTGAIWSLHSYTLHVTLSAQVSAHWNQNKHSAALPMISTQSPFPRVMPAPF